MNLLLDTHALLWWLDDPRLLSRQSRDAISGSSNLVFVSAAVAWEIAIKRAIGKLQAPENLEEVLAVNRFRPLAISVRHALALTSLPAIHSDPFDRIQVAQAKIEGLTLVSRDRYVMRYGISVIEA